MTIEKWQAFGSVRDFDDLFNRFLGTRGARNTRPEAWSIPLDVVQADDEIVVTASVPGATKDEIDVSVDDNVLTIKAESTSSSSGDSANGSSANSNGYLLRERRTGSYYRALRLPETIDYENAESTFKDGILTITLPKLESKKARKLEISAV
ncbi:MAG: Hsp20/alpha crystallin family protein [Dehalococcoidia bacterium]